MYTWIFIVFLLTRMMRAPCLVFSAISTSSVVMLMTTPFRWPVMAMRYPPNSPKNNFNIVLFWGCFSRSSVKTQREHCMYQYAMLTHTLHLHVQSLCADYRGTLQAPCLKDHASTTKYQTNFPDQPYKKPSFQLQNPVMCLKIEDRKR